MLSIGMPRVTGPLENFSNRLSLLEHLVAVYSYLVLTKPCKGHFHGSTLQMERARLREFNSLGQDHGTSKRQSQIQPEVAWLCASPG